MALKPNGKQTQEALDGVIQEEARRSREQGNMLVIDGGLAATSMRLRSFIERAEALKEEIKALQEDMTEVMNEAKGEGFDVPTIKAIMRLRAEEDPFAQLSMLKIYVERVGMSWPD